LVIPKRLEYLGSQFGQQFFFLFGGGGGGGENGKVTHETQETHAAGALPGFCSMKQLRVSPTPHPWMRCYFIAGIPPAVCRQYIFTHLGRERQCEVRTLVSGNNMMAGTGLKPLTFRYEAQRTNHVITTPSYFGSRVVDYYPR